ncbi:MAG: glycosyltransferase, partial [Treponema sp.]|nr:glycosyltransferase [Treponema sp.]
RAGNERLLIDFAYPGTDFTSLVPEETAPAEAELQGRESVLPEQRPCGHPSGGRTGHRDGGIAFIAVGAIEKRKGYSQLLGAFELLRKKGVDLMLTIVGPAYERGSEVEQAIFSSPNYGTSLFWYDSYVSDEKLASLYAESDAYISASWAEGFGLPVIEAASYGKPLILRDITVFHELGGEGAFYFSGASAESLADALEDWIALYRSSQAPLPSVRGRSWRSCAEDICRIILPEYRAAAAAEQEERKAQKPACDVSIIIVNYNTCRLLRDCLASIYAKTEGLAFEVLVSDNGSTDGSAEMVRKEFPQVELLENRANLGFGAANNRALDRAVGKYVFYLNSDTVLVNNAVKVFFAYWESHAGDAISCLGCNLMWPDGQFCRSAGDSRNGRFKSAADFRRNQRKLCFRSYRVAMRHYVFNRPLRLVEDQDPPVEKRVGQVGYVTGAALFLVNNEQARFDEGYFMYYEEVDLEYALSAAGKQPVLIDGPQIIHLEGASSVKNKYEIKDQTDFSKIQMSLSAIRFFKKHSLIGPVSLFFTKFYTALLWLNPLIFKSTRRYIRRLLPL